MPKDKATKVLKRSDPKLIKPPKRRGGAVAPDKRTGTKTAAGETRTVSGVLREAGLTREAVETKVADILLMNARETQEFQNDPDTSNFDLIVLSVVDAAKRTADCSRLDNLLEKVFGKTVRIEGDIKMHNTNMNMNVPLDQADEDLIRRALDRALKNNV